MSKNDPIDCFNKQECIYKECGMYDETVDICGIERLKSLKVAQAGQSVNPLKNQTSPEFERAVKEEMAKAAGLLTREAAEYIVKQQMNESKQATPREKIAGANKKPFTNAIDVNYGMKGIRLHGRLLDDPVEQELKTKKGPMVVKKFRLDDGTAEIRLTFWNVSKVPVLKAGDEITIDGLMGSEPYDGMPQASGGDYTKIIFEKA